MSTGAVRIRLDGVNAGYNGQPVIRDMDLEVREGEMHGLFGTNGAGKTTTLLTIAGSVKVLGGKLEINGHKHPGSLFKASKREQLALLTDDRGIFPPLSVRDNLRLGKGSVERAIEFFPELEEHLGRRAGLLSGGQQQMLALGRILAAEPSIILADELSLGLAPLVVTRLAQALRQAADAGAAVLLVEQHVPVALAAVDRASVLVRGKIELSDDAENLRANPQQIMDLYLSNAA
ncbi:ABC transporter ATP-binding protein [Microbacterium sp. A204]|uniref:ABC transporter ATP-binding protein n=1 Tax=Microbacterium sp. A204 TaxID=3457321 RepID=UPI003FD48AC6